MAKRIVDKFEIIYIDQYDRMNLIFRQDMIRSIVQDMVNPLDRSFPVK